MILRTQIYSRPFLACIPKEKKKVYSFLAFFKLVISFYKNTNLAFKRRRKNSGIEIASFYDVCKTCRAV
jgi:hypothetical protein